MLSEAADAADDILGDVFGMVVQARKDDRNYLTKDGFERVLQKFTKELLLAAKPLDEHGLKLCLQALDHNWKGMSPTQIDEALERAAAALGGVPRVGIAPVMQVMALGGQRFVTGAKQSASSFYDLNVSSSFNLVDQAVLDHALASQAHFIRNEYGKREVLASQRAREVVASGLERGFDRHAIGAELSAEMTKLGVKRAQSYWENVASIHAARSRSWGLLASFDEAGITEFTVSSTLDAVTCNACRFMDGQSFSTGKAIAKYHQVASSDDPEAVVDLQPFLGTAEGPDGQQAVFFRSDGGRTAVASVVESAVGQNDERGKFDQSMGRAGMEDAGICTPPFHGRCRCTLVPSENGLQQAPVQVEPEPLAPEPVWPSAKVPENLDELVRPAPSRTENHEVTPAGTPEEIVATNAKLEELAKQKEIDAAIEKLNALPMGTFGKNWAEHGLPTQPPDATGDYQEPFYDDLKALTKQKLAVVAKQKPKQIPISTIQQLAPQSLKWKVEDQIKALPAHVTLVKKGGVLYPASEDDQAAIVASHLLGHDHVSTKTIDLDKAAKPKPSKPVAVASPAPPPPPPAQTLDAATILHQKDGGAKGSNDGGFYTGSDGVKRYVKFYDDKAQAHCEHLANTIYTDLGHPAPKSTLFEHDGKVAYASDLFTGGKTLKELGGVHHISADDAKHILRGFVGDVLTGNWDALGTGFDNVMKLPNGQWVRIDNGGTFLMRAKAGRKPDAALNTITEWTGFFSSGINPYYSDLAAKAGVHSPDDMKSVVVEEIRKVLALRDSAGSWGVYVADRISDCPIHDRVRIVEMLDARSKLLEGKLAELTAAPKPLPAPGDARYVAKQYSDVLPRRGLKIEDLPHTDVIEDHYGKIDKDDPRTTTSGESYSDYKKRANESMSRIAPNSKGAIMAFTGSSYSSIRDSEDRGSPDSRSNDIQKAFTVATPEPGTVFRGIGSLPKAVIEKHLSSETLQLGKTGGATSSTSWMVDVSVDSFMQGKGDHYLGDQYKILYVLNQKSGIPIETISGIGEVEHEVLLKRDAKFRITGLSLAAGTKRVLIVEAIEIDNGHVTASSHVTPSVPTPVSAPTALSTPVGDYKDLSSKASLASSAAHKLSAKTQVGDASHVDAAAAHVAAAAAHQAALAASTEEDAVSWHKKSIAKHTTLATNHAGK